MLVPEYGGRLPKHVAEESVFYTGCPRRNVPDFGRVFLMLKYTDITQNTYVHTHTHTQTPYTCRCWIYSNTREVSSIAVTRTWK